MTTSESKLSLDQARAVLEDEHRDLQRLTTRLTSVRDNRELARVLDKLHPRLKRHFAREEFPRGLYDSMGALDQGHGDEVRELVDDHYRFLATVRGLATRAKQWNEETFEELQVEAATLAEGLRWHEQREHRLADALVHDH